MNKHMALLFAEYLKIRRSKVFIGTMVAFSIAPIMGAVFVIVLRNPDLTAANGLLQAKAALTGFSPNWPSFFNLIAQAIGVGGVIIFGFVASWVFGREYSDNTAKDLLVLPVSRFSIIVSKMIAVFLWSIILSCHIFFLALLLGFVLQLPGWSLLMLFESIKTISITFCLAVLLSTPVSFVASWGKGYLAPLAFVIMSVVFAQIIGALGFGAFFPWAIPAIFSKVISTNSVLGISSYLIVMVTSFIGFLMTVFLWKYTDQ